MRPLLCFIFAGNSLEIPPVAKPFSRKPLNHMRVDCVSWLRLNARMLREISASAHAHNVEYVAERSSLSFHVKSFKDDNFMLCQI